MIRTTFNKLREVKDSLPHGSMDAIATELGMTGDDVRDFFNGSAKLEGYHLEAGPDGGIVVFESTAILDAALRIAWVAKNGL